jgi:hypothetical protein
MRTLRRVLVVTLVLLAAAPASGWELRDTTYIEVGAAGFGPGIPEAGEGLSLGAQIGALIQEEEGSWVLYVRPALQYFASISTWPGDELQANVAGLSMSVGFGLAELGIVVPYVEVGLDPVGMFSVDPATSWDWGIGMHGDIGAVIGMGDMFILRPSIGVASFLFADMDRPMGGLWFSLAFGIDCDPVESYDGDDYEAPDDFSIQSQTLYPAPGSPGGALVWIQRSGDFTDAVNVWADPPAGTVAVPLPDPASGPDYWRILVHASPEACSEFSLPVHASGGGVQRDTTVWVSPSCGTGGAP